MRDRERDAAHSQLFRQLSRLAVETQRGPAGAQVGYFKVAPADSAAPPRPRRFHPRLVGRESRRVALITVGLALGVCDFAPGEDALDEPLPMPRDGALDARHLA